MAAQRISPGVYLVNGKRVNAANAALAEKAAGGDMAKDPASGGGAGKNPQGQQRILNKNTKINNVSDAIDVSQKVADAEAMGGLKYGNAGTQIGALGDSRTTTTDAQGNTTVTDSLSQGQQGIANADDQISQQGRQYAMQQFGQGNFGQQYTPQVNARTMGGDIFGADRQRIEDATFRNLTRNSARDKQQATQDLEQSMADRGIAIDPNDKSYAEAMRQNNQRFDDINANAMDRATQLGGQEQANAFGMQEQGIANQYSQGWGNRQNQFNEAQNLSNMGPGLRTSNFQQFQGVGYDLTDPNAANLALRGDKREQMALNKLGGGSRGPSGPQSPASPFNA